MDLALFVSRLEFTSSGSSHTEPTKVNCSLETRYRWIEHGAKYGEVEHRWHLGDQITVEDLLISA